MKEIVRKPSPEYYYPGLWHFLQDGTEYYLYVNCEQSAASFPVMIRLSPEEYEEYHALGWTFLQYMAEKINYWSSRYSARKVPPGLLAEAEAVIRRGKPPGP